MKVFLSLTVSILSLFCLFQSSPIISAAVMQNSQSSGITVHELQGPSVTHELTKHARASWPWYLSRASGIVAAGSLLLLMLSGIGQITGKAYRFLEPLTAWATHRALGVTFAISLLVHMLSLLFDTYAPFSILQILVPWLSNYHPVRLFGVSFGSLYVALGVLAFYGVAAVVITSFVWVEKKPYLWKWFHLLSYMITFFVFIHALYLGTDVSHGIFKILWLIGGIGIGIATLLRLWRARTI